MFITNGITRLQAQNIFPLSSVTTKIMWKSILFAGFVLLFEGCGLSDFPIDDRPEIKIDRRLIGKWTIEHSADRKTEHVHIIPKDEYSYRIFARDRWRKKEFDELAYLSQINNVRFLNISLLPGKSDSSAGYYFLRIVNIDSGGKKWAAAYYSDTSLSGLKSCSEVRNQITKNLDNPSNYIDTLYFYRKRKFVLF